MGSCPRLNPLTPGLGPSARRDMLQPRLRPGLSLAGDRIMENFAVDLGGPAMALSA